MKNKIAIASAFIAASSFSTAEIVINDFLSFEGFVDMSYTHSEADGDLVSDADNSYGIDQVEISWLFDFDPVTAQIDLEYEEAGDSLEVEQAFATYHFDNGGAITAGRFASMLGFEAFEPTGLYQYSFAYSTFQLGDFTFLPGYGQGVKYTQEGDATFFGFAIQDSISDQDDGELGGDGGETWGVEIAGAYYMDNGLSFFLGGAWEDSDNHGAGDNDSDQWLINAYTTFETGAWIFAAEVNYGESDGMRAGANNPDDLGDDLEAFSALIMANFAYSDAASITGRISYATVEDSDEEWEFIKYTLAHGYAFTDNLFLVTEVSFADVEFQDAGPDEDSDELSAAVELIFSF